MSSELQGLLIGGGIGAALAYPLGRLIGKAMARIFP
jgi:hypothetical protein